MSGRKGESDWSDRMNDLRRDPVRKVETSAGIALTVDAKTSRGAGGREKGEASVFSK